MSRYKTKYIKEILPDLIKKYPKKNRFQIHVLKKIIISMWLNE